MKFVKYFIFIALFLNYCPLTAKENTKIDYFQSLLKIDSKSGEPKFYGKINEIDLKDFNYYFKRTLIYSQNSKKMIYEYYEKQSLKGRYSFSYDRKLQGKWLISKASRYNINGVLNNLTEYFYSINSQTVTIKQKYFNDFGVLIRNSLYIYDLKNFDPILPGEALESNTESDFTPKEHILGKIEYN